MNTKILQKCLDELNKEPFKIDKVIGMLETMIEMSNSQQAVYPGLAAQSATNIQLTPSLNSYGQIEDEGSGLVAAYTGGLQAQLQ